MNTELFSNFFLINFNNLEEYLDNNNILVIDLTEKIPFNSNYTLLNYSNKNFDRNIFLVIWNNYINSHKIIICYEKKNKLILEQFFSDFIKNCINAKNFKNQIGEIINENLKHL